MRLIKYNKKIIFINDHLCDVLCRVCGCAMGRASKDPYFLELKMGLSEYMSWHGKCSPISAEIQVAEDLVSALEILKMRKDLRNSS